MTKTMRTLYALAAVVILGTVVYAQEKPKTVEKKALPNVQQDSGNLVRSLNTLQGDVTLQAGANISITPSGNALTIAAANALTGVVHNNTLTGNGTAASPLGVVSQDTGVDAFWDSGVAVSGNTTDFVSIPVATVPAGKQLIVQHVSMWCGLGGTDELLFATASDASGRGHYLDIKRGSGVNNIWSVSQPITLYLNPGEELKFSARFSRVSPGVWCNAVATGRFVPIQ